MTNQNDKRILELKAQIAIKKEKISKSQRFMPITNCSLDLGGAKYNLNTQTAEQLTFLLVRLNMYQMSAENLKIENFVISNYPATDWMEDIQNKLNVLSRKEEERKLKEMEAALDKLLSKEKKTELDIDNIAAQLGDN